MAAHSPDRRFLTGRAYWLPRLPLVAGMSVAHAPLLDKRQAPLRGTCRPYPVLPLMDQKPVRLTKRIGLAIAVLVAMITVVGMAIILLPVASLLPTPGGTTAKDLATPEKPH
jgi:hypothetical protein